MRIAIVSNTAWYLSNFRLNLMRALNDAGHSVVAIAPLDEYADSIRESGIRFLSVPISGEGVNPFVELRSVYCLWRIFRQEKIDIVLSYTPKGNLYSALASIVAGLKFVPNVSGLGRAFIKKSAVTRVVQVLYRITFRRAQRIFFQNNDDLNIFVNLGLVQADKTERLPGSGVDLSRFSPPSSVERPVGAFVFLLVARMLWDKGVGEYVTAARIVRETHPYARFQLLGFLDVANPSAISRDQVDAWVDEGIVEYLGHTNDVRPFFAGADCVVLPSYREGVPRTLLEAAAMARPIVTTNAPGCKDTVLDGETGWLCEPANADDLASKLLKVLALSPLDRAEMGARGRSFVEASFDEKIVIDKYVTLVAKLGAAQRLQT